MYQKHDLHACIVGHSFVRRLQDAVGGAPRILSHRDAAALNAPDWFRVQDHYHRVDFFGQSGYTVSMLQRDITSAGLLYPDVVIIESGSNDLCYRECDIDALVTGLFSYASMLREVHGVRLVIMASVLNRDRCRQVSPAQFRSRAFAFNRKMAARAARTPGVKFEVLRGFWRDPLGAPLPVSAWAGDGIHPAQGTTRPASANTGETSAACSWVRWPSWTGIFATKRWVVFYLYLVPNQRVWAFVNDSPGHSVCNAHGH